MFSGSIITNGKNSLDDVSSIVGDSSRRSLLDTSVTSAATTTVSPQSIQNDDAGSDVTCVSPQPDVLRIYVPYDTPTKKSPTSVSNKIINYKCDCRPVSSIQNSFFKYEPPFIYCTFII